MTHRWLIPVALAAGLALTACQSSAVYVAQKPSLEAPPAALIAECGDTADIPTPAPGKTLPEKTARKLWGQDRAALVECGMRHAGLVRFYTKRDEALVGQASK